MPVYAAENILLLLFLVNTAWNLYLSMWMRWVMKPIELSQAQMMLLGVRENEVGFRALLPKTDDQVTVESTKRHKLVVDRPNFSIEASSALSFSPSSLDSSLKITSSMLNQSVHSVAPSLHSSVRSPLSMSPSSLSPSASFSPNTSITSTSWLYMRESPYLRPRTKDTMHLLDMRSKPAPAPIAKPENIIKDDASLTEYLKDFEDTASKLDQFRECEQRQSNSPSDAMSSPPQRLHYEPAVDPIVMSEDLESRFTQLKRSSALSLVEPKSATELSKAAASRRSE